jgi:hypothetical protein
MHDVLPQRGGRRLRSRDAGTPRERTLAWSIGVGASVAVWTALGALLVALL